MRELRQTSEHLLIITVVFFLCVAIILAIPAVRGWVFNNVPAAIVKEAGSGATASLMVGLDPHMLATAVNNEETRDDLVKLWSETLPQIDPDAMAQMGNELLSDPNTSVLIVNVISQLKPEAASALYNSIITDPVLADYILAILPKLDPQALASFSNSILASPGTAKLVNGLIENADNHATAMLANRIMANADEETGENITFKALNEIIGLIDPVVTANFFNSVFADPGVADFVNALSNNGDPGDMAAIAKLLDKILGNVTADNAGNPVYVTIEQLDQFLGSLDGTTTSDFVWKVMDTDGFSKFCQNLLSILDENGNVDPDCPTFKALESLLTPGQGLHKMLFGELGVNDALCDYLWNEQNNKRAFYEGGDAKDQEGLTQIIIGTIRYNLGGTISEAMKPLVEGVIAPYIAGMLECYFTRGMFQVANGVSNGVRVTDLSFGMTVPWEKPNYAAWNKEAWDNHPMQLKAGDILWKDPAALAVPDPEHDWRSMGGLVVPPWERHTW
jgi:hypothetical protein